MVNVRILSHKVPAFEARNCKNGIITFLEVFLIGEVVAIWSVEVRVGGFDWLVAEAEAEFPTPQGVCSGNELDNDILLPPPGDIGG